MRASSPLPGGGLRNSCLLSAGFRLPSTGDAGRTVKRHLPIVLKRDLFLRTLLRELAGTLEEVMGEDEAAGFVSVVGQHIGDWINDMYKVAFGADKFDRETVAEVLVDLKHHIQGDFYIVEVTENRIILGNRACPFGEHVRDRNSLCMITSNVFGTITSEHLGYARVELGKDDRARRS